MKQIETLKKSTKCRYPSPGNKFFILFLQFPNFLGQADSFVPSPIPKEVAVVRCTQANRILGKRENIVVLKSCLTPWALFMP